MTTNTIKTETSGAKPEVNKEHKAQIKTFMQKQWGLLRRYYSIERVFLPLVFAGVLLGFAATIKLFGHYVVSYSQYYAMAALVVAGVLIARSCKYSLTPATIILLIGLGGQYLLSCHVQIAYMTKEYLQIVTGAGIGGFLMACFCCIR